MANALLVSLILALIYDPIGSPPLYEKHSSLLFSSFLLQLKTKLMRGKLRAVQKQSNNELKDAK